MPEVSIILPVYKAENYLPQCIDSILCQSFRDFELLLIDDGSPDRCGEICERYAALDDRIRVFHRKNAGVSESRNFGLQNAGGTYVMFCDSDDYVRPDWVRRLVELIREENVFLGICRYAEEGAGSRFSDQMPCNSFPRRFSPTRFYFELQQADLDHTVWNKIFLRETIETFGLRFEPNCTYGEDTLFIVSYMEHSVGDIGFCPDLLYVYRRSIDGSLSHRYIPGLWDNMQKLLKGKERLMIRYGIDLTKEKRVPYADILYWKCDFAVRNCLMRSAPIRFAKRIHTLRQITGSRFYRIAVENSSILPTNRKKCRVLRGGRPLQIYLYNTLHRIQKKYYK